jgi:anti-sigma regulatory factor (Ser/Thr protein kinase)
VNREITRRPFAQPVCPAQAREFAVLLSSTRRGARLARLLTVAQLCSWGLPTETAAQVVAELAANAALHAKVPGRNFRLALALVGETTLRIEVSDTCGGQLPSGAAELPPADAESGRGLLVVRILADRWDVVTGPPPRKTVWAEIAM